MADTKISAMPSASTLTGTEIVPLVQSGGNVQATTTNFVNQTIAAGPAATRTALGLGTMAVQNANAVAVTGGAIDNTTVGATTPARVNTSALKTTGLVGYLYGNNNTGDVTASTTIPASAITGLNPGYYGAFHFDTGTTLTATLSQVATASMSVASTAAFASSGNVMIEDEVISYTGKTATTLTGLTRGVAGTSASSHASSSPVTAAQITAANTATTVLLNTTDHSNGVSVVSNTQITFAHAGTYNIAFSAQLFNHSTSNDNSVIWFSLNGTDIAESASVATTVKKDGSTAGSTIVAANIFVTVTAGQYVEMKWLSVNGTTSLVTYPSSAAPVYPAAPAIIVTANQLA